MQFVLPNETVKDILNSPLLVMHFLEHGHEDDHKHLADFIAERYSADGHKESHDKDHKNLPFHHNGPVPE